MKKICNSFQVEYKIDTLYILIHFKNQSDSHHSKIVLIFLVHETRNQNEHVVKFYFFNVVDFIFVA